MATLTINGQQVTVDDSFLQLSPEQQEATVEEIAASLGSEQQDGISTSADIAASGISGIGRGVADLAGLPGTLSDLFNDAATWGLSRGYEAITGEQAPDGSFFGRQQLPRSVFSGQDARQGLSAITGGASDYQPQTTAGRYASTVGEFLPGAAAFGGASPANLARFGVLPAVASEGAGQLTEGSTMEPYARTAAALIAPAIPAIASKAISPFAGRISPERQSAVDYLRSEGIEPTAGQITGNRNLLARESELGGVRAADMMDDQARAFTDAAMRRAGGSGLADEVGMTAINDRLSQGFRDVSARNTMQADAPMLRDMVDTLREYNRVLPSEQKTILGNIASDIGERIRAGGGKMSGQDYQMIRSDLGKRAHNARVSNPELAEAFRGIRNSLDDAMARSVSPEDAATWANLRREYGNMKVLEKASTGGGEKAALGTISPAKLRQAAMSGRQGQYARGTGDFDQLARSGSAVLAPLPDSGTATRLNARTIGGIGAAMGAGGGFMVGSPMAAMGGAIAGTALPAAAGRALMSSPVQSYLVNQVAPQMSVMDPRYAAVIQALLSGEQ